MEISAPAPASRVIGNSCSLRNGSATAQFAIDERGRYSILHRPLAKPQVTAARRDDRYPLWGIDAVEMFDIVPGAAQAEGVEHFVDGDEGYPVALIDIRDSDGWAAVTADLDGGMSG